MVRRLHGPTLAAENNTTEFQITGALHWRRVGKDIGEASSTLYCNTLSYGMHACPYFPCKSSCARVWACAHWFAQVGRYGSCQMLLVAVPSNTKQCLLYSTIVLLAEIAGYRGSGHSLDGRLRCASGTFAFTKPKEAHCRLKNSYYSTCAHRRGRALGTACCLGCQT